MTQDSSPLPVTQHKIWHLPADVDTDALAPGAYMQHGIDVIAQHCLENLLPQFASAVKPGDVLVAGPNFGIGSSREQAAAVLVHLGVAAVIAPSYGGLFFRNAFNLGLLLLTCREIDLLQNKEQTIVYLRGQLVYLSPESVETNQPLVCAPVPDFLLAMVQAGGLLPHLKQQRALAAVTAHA
jgi:3-isopropylmalate/(R)-2-methylmalate dehydratase small subunit